MVNIVCHGHECNILLCIAHNWNELEGSERFIFNTEDTLYYTASRVPSSVKSKSASAIQLITNYANV